jgi:glycosyltransferase involved in cell wall biosynthesis
MDLYPELAVALGEVRPGLFVDWINRTMRRCYRRTDRVVALDEDMATHLCGFGIEPRIIRPWVPRSMVNHSATQPESPWTWIYSGNLGRAHDWETLLDAQAILEQRGADIRLVFQGSGPSWPAAQARARELQLRRCEWKDYVSDREVRASILRCHCAVVSQRPIAQGLLWPSKLALLLTIPRPILWVGPKEGAIARELRALPLTGIFASGEASAIAEWLLALRADTRTVSADDRIDPLAHRNAAVAAWRDIVGST